MKTDFFSTINKFILLTVIYSITISFTRTTFVLFLYSKGFTSFETNMIFSAFNISVILFEPLASSIGEILGCRFSFVIGCLLKVLTAFLFLNVSNMETAIMAELLSGLSAAFISGSLTAWAVNKMKEEGSWHDNSYEVFTRISRYKSIFIVFGGLSGAYMGQADLSLPWLAGLICFFILAVISMIVMKEGKTGKEGSTSFLQLFKEKRDYSFDSIFHGYKAAVKNNILMLLLFSSFISSLSLISLQMFRMPMIKGGLEISQVTLGYVWIIIEGARLLGSFFVNKYYRSFSSPVKGLIMLPFFSSLFLIMAFYFNKSFIMIIFFFLFEFLEPFYNSLKEFLINAKSENNGRLTILSLENIIDKIGSAIGLLWIGYLADVFTMGFAWYFASALFSLTSLVYLSVYLLENKKVKEALTQI